MQLSELQNSLHRYLLGAEPSPALRAAVRYDGIPVDQRLAIYRNNVSHALIEAMIAAYPVVQRLVGESFFLVVARDFIRAHPPTRSTLIGFGAGFGDYLQSLAACAKLPYLGDVARLEAAWLEAYHAPDAHPLEADDLRSLPVESLAELHLPLHPSARLLSSRYPVREIYRLNRQPGLLTPLQLTQGPEYSLLVRPRLEVLLMPLSVGAHMFLCTLGNGANLNEAFDETLSVEPDFDLQSHLHEYLGGGVFASRSE